MQRTVVKFSGSRLSGYRREEDAGDIPYRCSNGEGVYVLCGRCGKWMEFDSDILLWKCGCGNEIIEERVKEYAFLKFREEMKGN